MKDFNTMMVQPSEFYLKQASIPRIGREGLAKLGSSTVAVTGVGGVGSSTAYYLARSGVGEIRLIDQDIIEPSNLQRIQSANKEDLFHPKAETIARRLSEFGGLSKIVSIVETIADKNVYELLDGVDLVLDGLDNFRTRYIVNRFSVRNKIPYMFVSAVAEQAHFALVNPPDTPCLECMMPNVSDRFEDSCETLGVSPTITGLAGAISAETVIRFIVERASRLMQEMLTVDMSTPEFLFTKVSKRRDCAACGDTARLDPTSESSVTILCGEHTANVLPPSAMNVNLSMAGSAMTVDDVLFHSDSVLVFQDGSHIVSLFPTGRLLIGGISDEDQASQIANRIWHSLKNQ